ncbi:MAG: YeeE/YedE family protein [Thalassobaculaceae bacterium]|nr:YeeE/YedE family protein [Thalassobaculaceae bacterium]
MRILISLLSGLLFGLGLAVSDMIDPARVLGFLQVAGGAWDPTLAFVMGGALVPMAVAWLLTRRLSSPVCGERFPEPPSGRIDGQLLVGSALFGAGWGLVGFCPGPAFAALAQGGQPVLIFVAAMVGGFWIGGRVLARILALRTDAG